MLRLLLLLLLCWPAAAAEPYRFVFAIDSSQSMASRKPAVIKTVRALIQSGFNGQIMEGDTFEIWTFGSRLHDDRFPLQQWNPQRAPLLAEIAAQFLDLEKFRGRTQFRNVSEPVKSWITNQANALLFVLTDGLDPIVGVPNDIEVNEYLGPRRAKARAAKRVFLISMLVRQGHVVEWRGHDGLGRAELPLLPVREVEKPPVAEAPPPVVAPVVEAMPPPAVELPPGAKLVIVETPPDPKPNPVLPPAPDPIIPAPVTIEPIVKEAVPEPPKTEPIVEVVEETVAPAAVVVAPPIAVIEVEKSRRTLYLAIGAAILLVLLLLFRRRPSERASLISKSLSQK